MTMRPQPESRAVTNAYRAASDALDERPAAAVRSAILAAAARAVAAKPHAVGAPLRRWRMPLAAAATVLISTVAVILAQRTQQQVPQIIAESAPSPSTQEIAGAARPDPPNATAAPEVGATVPAVRSESAAARGVLSRPAGAARAPRQEPAARADSPAAAASGMRASADAAIAARESERDPERARGTQPPQSAASAPIDPSAASNDKVAAAIDQSAAPSDKATAAGEQAGALGSATRDAQPRALERRAAAADETAPATRSSIAKAETPERWLARIVELRQAGRDVEADAELKKLRERHPALAIPATALRRTATR